FFVMLLSMSSMDRERMISVSSFLRGAVGVLEGGIRGPVKTPKVVAQKARVGNSLVFEVNQSLTALGLTAGQGADVGTGVSVVEQGDDVLITLQDVVLFQGGSAQLSDPPPEVLRVIARVLKKYPFAIRVLGHADRGGEGSERKALRLSLQRALSVVNYLQVREGIAEGRLTAAGFGAMHPVGSNLTEAGRARNRRVEIAVVVSPRG
ncbi:MAG: OmpA family protein, partial [Nitrospinota bacterium]